MMVQANLLNDQKRAAQPLASPTVWPNRPLSSSTFRLAPPRGRSTRTRTALLLGVGPHPAPMEPIPAVASFAREVPLPLPAVLLPLGAVDGIALVLLVRRAIARFSVAFQPTGI